MTMSLMRSRRCNGLRRNWVFLWSGSCMELRVGQCAIRSWRMEDKESLVKHANDRNVWINLRDAFPFPYMHLDADQWLSSATNQNPETQFAIDVDGAAVGGIGVILKGDVYRG